VCVCVCVWGGGVKSQRSLVNAWKHNVLAEVDVGSKECLGALKAFLSNRQPVRESLLVIPWQEVIAVGRRVVVFWRGFSLRFFESRAVVVCDLAEGLFDVSCDEAVDRALLVEPIPGVGAASAMMMPGKLWRLAMVMMMAGDTGSECWCL
jgi:hypothetical protein